MSEEQTNKDMSNREATITLNTRITIATLALIVSAITPGVVLYLKMDSMQNEMRNTWSLQQQVLWSERLGAANPELKVPKAEEVFILVNKKR